MSEPERQSQAAEPRQPGLIPLRMRGALRDATLIGTVVSGVVLVLTPFIAWLMLSLFNDFVRDWARDLLGIDDIAHRIQQITTETGLITQQQGFSFIEQPVYRGDSLVVRYVVTLTEDGARCELTDTRPLFYQANGTRVFGKPIDNSIYIGRSRTRLRMRLAIPDRIDLGRTALMLHMRFQCAEGATRDTTDPLYFDLRADPNEQ